ncbi:MAG TPA: class I tRNA ligase family protein [Candidatus Humimicrobiaceae bacterium]|nr:class I tRNA ligase family protein [Candidatus Humimicrobiaceae bacterium]
MEINFSQKEKKILKFWRQNGIFKKSIQKRKKAPDFVFFEGPPTANAKPGIHHVLSRVYKDVICRYKTMQGFKVLRKAGWDTHGLPVELEIEKKLGLRNKKDIEKYGIAKFNKLCKQSVWNYKKDWENLTERIAFWLDMKNPYITYQPNYIETVWWIIKQIWQKGLLYKDYKVVPYCARCGTGLSSHEVALGYKRIREPAIYIKFPVLNPEFKKTFLLAWTTTPWTLPGNVAVAVNPEFTYVKVKIGEEYLILAKERMGTCGAEGETVKEFKGRDLVNLRYQPLYPFSEEIIKGAYRVISADFVSLEEGTGLVHIAPAFGEEDMIIGKENRLPTLLTVDEEGKFKLGVKKWARMFIKEADPLIIDDLKSRNLLFKKEIYEHDYPFCWRCHSPLFYYAKESWFIRVTKIKKSLIKNNQRINWIPAHLKKGRFGEWLKEVKDWALTRERYWGTPLPIWQCRECGYLEVIGSKKDLVSQKFSENKYFLLRHGTYPGNLEDIVVCWPEKRSFPLTKEGENQIKAVAQKLKNENIDLIFSSDLLRTKQTAEIIGKELGIKPKFDKKLREISVGILNGKPIKEIGRFWDKEKKLSPLEYYSRRFQVAPPEGENYTDIERRMYQFIKRIDKKYQGKNILIVGHQRPLTLLEKANYGYDLKRLTEIVLRKKEIKTGELRKFKFKSLPYNKKMELDFHRPYVDEVKFCCQNCNALMERAPEVIDCWFDSGAMPFAQYHYPFENKALINKKIQFPADYISEAIDQTRGWFYTLLAISSLLEKGPTYKNVLSVGHVLDEKGEKMSKSKGNVVDPWYIVEKYGADATRWYFYTVNQPGDSKLFSEKDVDQALKKFILTFWNCFTFYNTYIANISRGQFPLKSASNVETDVPLLERWAVSKLNRVIHEVTQKLDEYDITGAARIIENFVINDFSLWYIRRSRKRFDEAANTLRYTLLTLSKLTAPFIPFLSEEIYQKIQNSPKQINFATRQTKSKIQDSVHLDNWPKANKKLINRVLEKKMEKAREAVAKGLAERAKVKIKVRQPLAKLKIKDLRFKLEAELLDLIKEEVNVKEIIFDPKIKGEVELDTEITPELREAGIIREVIRQIQEMRKIAGFRPKDKISVNYFGPDELSKILEKNKNFIFIEGKISNFVQKEKGKEVFAVEKEAMVDQQKLWLAIKKN